MRNASLHSSQYALWTLLDQSDNFHIIHNNRKRNKANEFVHTVHVCTRRTVATFGFLTQKNKNKTTKKKKRVNNNNQILLLLQLLRFFLHLSYRNVRTFNVTKMSENREKTYKPKKRKPRSLMYLCMYIVHTASRRVLHLIVYFMN